MNEIYGNVSDKAKEIADIAWRLTVIQKNPVDAAKFLDNVTNYYRNILTEEEIDFLQFYFNMKMEMMKE